MDHAAKSVLLLTIHLPTGRYHGEPEWPPSPARLFQALLAGAVDSDGIPASVDAALRWLEALPSPIILAPRVCTGQEVKFWVPNNDLDKYGGDPDKISAIRTGKRFRPRIFHPDAAFLYAWSLPLTQGSAGDDKARAQEICSLALKLYQLGRGVDIASASARLLDEQSLDGLLASTPGQVFRPSLGATGSGRTLACPQTGSLDSLQIRYRANLDRFQQQGSGRSARTVFHQPPRPRFRLLTYDSPPRRLLFDLRQAVQTHAFSSTPLTSIASLTEAVRDAAASRLSSALPQHQADIERALIGRPVKGLPAAPAGDRIRILPLPSIGHRHVDRGIRRLLVEVPSQALLRVDDLSWALSGLVAKSPTGARPVLVPADDTGMLRHYGIETSRDFCTWRSVTPAALPLFAARRRIDPARQHEQAKGAPEWRQERRQALKALRQALRHANITAAIEDAHVQREPFKAKGSRAEAFAKGTRFAKERLWHVELSFRDPVAGPLVIGDGRFLGLGLMAPVRSTPSLLVFDIVAGLSDRAEASKIVASLRRAVMARYQQHIGPRSDLPPFVSGHQKDGQPAGLDIPHLYYSCDLAHRRLLVTSPATAEHRAPKQHESRLWRKVVASLSSFCDLRAGTAGLLSLQACTLSPDNELAGASRTWTSITPYTVDRHRKRTRPSKILVDDIQTACIGLGLPRPAVTLQDIYSQPDLGLCAMATLSFEVAIAGPMMLGRTRHKGGGLFGHRQR